MKSDQGDEGQREKQQVGAPEVVAEDEQRAEQHRELQAEVDQPGPDGGQGQDLAGK